jgi:hypothetical protein
MIAADIRKFFKPMTSKAGKFNDRKISSKKSIHKKLQHQKYVYDASHTIILDMSNKLNFITLTHISNDPKDT